MTGPVGRRVRDDGSIKHVVVGVVFESRPGQDALREALQLHKGLEERYPRRQEHRAAAVAVSADRGVVDAVDAGELAGFSFDYVNPDGNVKQALSCLDQVLRIARVDRSDLDQVWREAAEELTMVLGVLGQDLNNLLLERLDRFVWDGPRDEFRAASVFRRGTRWLSPNVFCATDLWHSHHGLFEYSSQPHPHRLLHVVEVGTAPGDEARPREPGMPVVADVKQSLTVLHGMEAPDGEHRVMPAAELLDGQGLLRDYFTAVLHRTESVLSDIVREPLYREIEFGARA